MINEDLQITIREALGGDHQAFEMVIRHYSRTVYSIAYSILQNAETAEDVVQETFLKAYKSRWKIRSPEKFQPWLFTIARNQARTAYRRKSTLPLPDDGQELEDPSHITADRRMDGETLHSKVHSILKTLPEHHRTAITLRYLEGMDHRTIESTMGLTNGALRGILGRGLETLREALTPLIQET